MLPSHPYPPNLPVAAIFRLRDGQHQASVLKPVARQLQLRSYALLGYALRSFEFNSPFPISTMSEVAGEVWVFVNGPLESVNHMFLHELVGQAVRPECGLVSGRALDLLGQPLTFQPWRFFAAHRSFLQQIGGLSRLDASAPEWLFEGLAQQVTAAGRQVVETSLAVATFEEYSFLQGSSKHG